jgi:hypothetical protein
MSDLFSHQTLLPTGKYLHWDELKRRQAPGDLSHDEWWAAVSLARSALLESCDHVLDGQWFNRTRQPRAPRERPYCGAVNWP